MITHCTFIISDQLLKLYKTMDHETLEREYSPSSCIDDIMVYIEQYINQSATAREILKEHIRPNVKYGPETRSTMDVFIPEGKGPFPVHIFIHGGYWQELSKNESSFAAPNFLDHGIIFIALDYTLAPEANMSKIINLMNEFGAEFYPKDKKFLPLKLVSSELPIGIKYKAGVSAQLKSAVILAGTNSFGTTTIIEQKKSRDHTENMLVKNSQAIKIVKGKKKIIKIFGKKHLDSININVPGDPSSAAFFTALTLLNKNSILKIKNVGLNSTRIGFYELLKKCGAKIKFKNLKKNNEEIYGDIYVESSKIKPIKASKEYYVKATDEYPILFVIAALTKGISIFRGINDLANKESNRIKEMQTILKQVGIKTVATKDGIKIYGKTFIENKNKKINVPDLGDHRICMSTLILSLITGVKTKINNFETVYTSSPSFLKIIKSLGGKFEFQK